ncbi:hypothetical protein, partial [Pseudomonas sp. FSL R10-0765]|uniref:hypothetical protein n=1 Tax=Pseudomonas sp. FSL R10-0765 TaxID=2662195 RepID=UPI001C49B661
TPIILGGHSSIPPTPSFTLDQAKSTSNSQGRRYVVTLIVNIILDSPILPYPRGDINIKGIALQRAKLRKRRSKKKLLHLKEAHNL